MSGAERLVFDLLDVSWWDETHRQCVIGSKAAVSGKKKTIQLPRKKDGALALPSDKEEGVCNEAHRVLNVKFAQEVRLSLGCAMHKDDNDNKAAAVHEPFDHSGKKVLSVEDWNKKVDEACQVVNDCTEAAALAKGWIVNNREEDVHCSDDPCNALANLGRVTERKLSEWGINNVSEFCARCQDECELERLTDSKE